MKTRNQTSSSESLALDDASTLESATGGTPLVHGLAIDTIARSVPSRTLPLFVRESLFRAWPGMNGNVVNVARPNGVTSQLIPWYSYDVNSSGETVESVAERLTVDTSDAENWALTGAGRFGRYADLPLNDASFARYAFWRYDPDANEFDPQMMLEPQVYAHDALSQLFTECCAFHFGYLADIDAEYHRLRDGGVVAQFDEEAVVYEPWYRLYHYWRHQIYVAYLGGGGNPVRIRLPQHLADGNWRIKDVLDELEHRLEGQGGYIHNDMIVTGKGYARGMETVTLGLQQDAKYSDGDGNPRFYHPYSQNASSASMSVNTPGWEIDVPAGAVEALVAGGQQTLLSTVQTVSGQQINVVADTELDELSVGGMWNAYSSFFDNDPPWFATLNAALEQGNVDFAGNFTAEGRVYTGFDAIHDLPYNGILTSGGVDYNYWTGHTLNLFEFIEFMRYVGQSTEPEVVDKLLVPMGVVIDCNAFKRRPSGATATSIDELYNLYESQSSFNENPARKFTAAHLGPTNHEIPRDQTDPRSLALRGNVLSTEQDGQLLTVRERYWTPGSLTAQSAQEVANAFLPGVVLKTILYPNLDIEAIAGTDDNTLREFLARTLGTVGSMRTKVEKPVYLLAGKTGPESTFASGVGVGAVQLVYEILHALCGGKPRFGLGYGGFSDISMTPGEAESSGAPSPWEINTRAQAVTEASGVATFAAHSDLDSVIDALSSLRYPGPSDILSETYSDMITDHVVDNNYKSALNMTRWNALGNLNSFSGASSLSTEAAADYADRSLLPADAGPFRRENVTASQYLSAGMGACGVSLQSNYFAFPTSVAWGAPVLQNGSAADIMNALMVSGSAGNIMALPDVTYTSGTGTASADTNTHSEPFIEIAVIPHEIIMTRSTLGNNLASIPASERLAVFPLTAQQVGSKYPGITEVPVGDTGRPLYDDTELVIPMESDTGGASYDHVRSIIVDDIVNFPPSQPTRQVDTAMSTMGAMYENGQVVSQAFGFPFLTPSTSGSAGFAIQEVNSVPFRTVYPTMQPSEIIRTFGVDMWANWARLAGNDLDLNEVNFVLRTRIYHVDTNARKTPLPANGPFIGHRLVTHIGTTHWAMGIRPRAESEPNLTVDDLNVTCTSRFTPAYVSADRDVSLNLMTDPNQGTHVMLFGTDWNVSGDLSSWNGASSVDFVWNYVRGWRLPASDSQAIALDYALWSSYGVDPDHPVSRMMGVWHGPEFDFEPVDVTQGYNSDMFPGELYSTVDNWHSGNAPRGQYDNFFMRAGLTGFVPDLRSSATAGDQLTGNGIHGVSPVAPTIYPGQVHNPTQAGAFYHYGINGAATLSAKFMTFPAPTGSVFELASFNMFADEVMSCATYVYPDLPNYKMRFRPYRRVADATLMMEQKLTFMNDGEDVSPLAGPLGIKVIGTPKQFRFADLVDAGQPETFLLEPVRSRTRLIDPSHRSVLTFTKLALLDQDSQTHTIPDVIMAENQKAIAKGNSHSSGFGGKAKVYSRATIRDIQLGRQFQRM